MSPSERATAAAAATSPIEIVKPRTRVRRACRNRCHRRRTIATPSAAIATNSGPITIAPITRMTESVTIAIAASRVASTMKLANVQVSADSS